MKHGTGGSGGAAYLRTTLARACFRICGRSGRSSDRSTIILPSSESVFVDHEPQRHRATEFFSFLCALRACGLRSSRPPQATGNGRPEIEGHARNEDRRHAMTVDCRPQTETMSLARHYSRFRVSERLLLTGHSHQAWPDVAFDAQQRAWLDAAEFVDGKWERAAEQAARVRDGYRQAARTTRRQNIALGAEHSRIGHALVVGAPVA